MLDLRAVAKDPEGIRESLLNRGWPSNEVKEQMERLVALDRKRRRALREANELKALRNRVSKEIGEARRAGRDAAEEILEMRRVGERISTLDRAVGDAEAELRVLLLDIPNRPDAEVPLGGVEANEVVRSWGSAPGFDFEPRPHWEVAEELGMMDLAAAARISGSGFIVLRGSGARLQRGLINWMIGLHVSVHGYEEVRVPYLVKTEALVGTGQLPKFMDESYLTSRDNLWLIPTAEVPVTNLHREQILPDARLPLKYVAYSPCFRREAGAAGRDTRGMLRVHQFDKVELVRFERPEDSREALEELLREAEAVVQALGLRYRVVRLAARDLGFAASLTYDIEVWAPGVKKWLEISSCTTFGDYQSRRAEIRYRPKAGHGARFLHTLNGSGLALPRLMVALIETGQRPDGSVRLPEALAPFVGTDRIEPGRT